MFDLLLDRLSDSFSFSAGTNSVGLVEDLKGFDQSESELAF
jgi:hypothetical protein